MAQLCIPLPMLDTPRAVDVEVTIDGVRQTFHYRSETLQWADYQALSRVEALQAFLDGHEPSWQLVALGAPTDDALPVLFRYHPTAEHPVPA